MPFDAHAHAGTLEHLAKNRLDTSDGLNANIALAQEWSNLSQKERNDTASALVQDYSNHKWNTLPQPVIHLDQDGNCNAIDFTASRLDINKGPHHVKVSNDGDVATWVSAD